MRKIRTVLLLCLLSVFTLAGTACDQPQESSPSLVKVPFDHAFECEPGTFWLRDVFLTAEIQTEDQVYRSETAYLVVRTEFDFENYALKECGVTVYNYDSSDDGSYYYINYFRTDRGFLSDEIGGSEDLDLSLTQALSPDLHLDGQPGPVRGTAWFCFRIPAEIQDYLYEQAEKEAGEMTWEEQFNFGLYLDLNDVYYQAPLTTTQIGCRLDQIDVYETYPIQA